MSTFYSVSRVNFVANFGPSPAPFTIKVNEEFIAFTKQKVALTRFPEDVDQPDFTDGPPVHNGTTVRDYWVNEYDWDLVQTQLNAKLIQYTTTVLPPPGSSYVEPVPLHFVHHISSRHDAIPLLFIHGWPGSFIEVEKIIDSLTSPSSSTDPAFHVVAPSVPGFGFSPAPVKPGFGYMAAAHTFDALMKQLGYSKYVIQGGDQGAFILRYQAHLHPESVVAVHSNFWIVPPNSNDLQRYQNNETTEDETVSIEAYEGFTTTFWGYGQIQQTRPLRLGFGMTDSPIGFAMWIYDGMWGIVNNPGFWTPEDIITWTMMMWIQGPYGASRIYKEAAKEGGLTLEGVGTYPFVNQPVAISEFAHDLGYRTLLLEDIRGFFGNRELSNTAVF
ncbi:Epoxide Hydratase [Hyphodiscus hymeniophilus]|uniref:Epoxide Hydratase n=1 Tax=Hyphodiscus hymeniophilus TaxID=353542 RepID=A0A9P6VN45_9HELO|nr:Epoxide Hydratase [Hyphodiscus hymeniophilus]